MLNEITLKIILAVAFIMLLISGYIIRIIWYKRSVKKIYLHADTYRQVINTMIEYKRLAAEGKFAEYKHIDEYMKKSIDYANNYAGKIPKYKYKFMDKTSLSFNDLYDEYELLRSKVDAKYNDEDKKVAKSIKKLFDEFVACLKKECEYCNYYNIILEDSILKPFRNFKNLLKGGDSGNSDSNSTKFPDFELSMNN